MPERSNLPSGGPAAFLSYSRENSVFVLRLVDDLKAAGANVWLDQLDIKVGNDWDTAIHDALAQCSWMLVVLSPASVRSKNVQDEIALARDENKTIIPILLEDCVIPWRLRRLQYVDFRKDYEPALKVLLETLCIDREWSHSVAPRAKRPDRAENQHKPMDGLRREAAAQQRVAEGRSRADDGHKPETASEAPDEVSRAEQAAQFILARTQLRPRMAVVLGSGLGAFADELHDAVRIPYVDIPFFPKSTALGHVGTLVIGTFEAMPVAVMQGRAHFYEGYTLQQVAFPIRALAWMGVKALVLTNAAGGINPAYERGALVVLRDHINLQGGNPLIGPNDDRFGVRFPDMTDAYNADFRRFALDESARLHGGIYEGVYAGLGGPSYETPAEIRFLRTIGADLVGMSTVPEVIVARHMGLEVLALSCVTNMAAGITGDKLTHEEVMETGLTVRGKFLALVRAVLPKIEAWLNSSRSVLS